ncbi:MAG TPA: hypothetical protein VGD12_07170, partial [Blastococcus sp.]
MTGTDPLGRGRAARSKATDSVVARTTTADRVVQSVCPYCAVGCAQNVYVQDDLDQAMEMIADRVLDARRKTWQHTDDEGRYLRRTMGIASLGGATLD